jgi:hypothetical protein
VWSDPLTQTAPLALVSPVPTEGEAATGCRHGSVRLSEAGGPGLASGLALVPPRPGRLPKPIVLREGVRAGRALSIAVGGSHRPIISRPSLAKLGKISPPATPPRKVPEGGARLEGMTAEELAPFVGQNVWIRLDDDRAGTGRLRIFGDAGHGETLFILDPSGPTLIGWVGDSRFHARQVAEIRP